MTHWANKAIFYHIYPLGFCGAPEKNDFTAAPVNRLSKIESWIEHMRTLNISALYLGPLFESSSHGYDTKEYTKVDRRLGDEHTLKSLVSKMHNNGIRVVFDAVFNHVGRDFPQFCDLQHHQEKSQYKNWFAGVDFKKKSPYGDPFSYTGWHKHYDLVKLNLKNSEVKNLLFDTIRYWIEIFDIDGIRLDAADCMDLNFLQELTKFCKSIKNDFWLMGEIVHGDYREWTEIAELDSVTNYECYKGLWSSFNDSNFFEIAYSLNRQFGEEGIYKNATLYSFADNHDVARVASALSDEQHLHPLYCLLFTMPGIPSIYYGSEFGVRGKKKNNSDQPMRPALNLEELYQEKELLTTIQKLTTIRNQSHALQYGRYQELYIDHKQLLFERSSEKEQLIIAINGSEQQTKVQLKDKNISPGNYYDLLNNEQIQIDKTIELYSNWGRILIPQT